MEKLKKCMKKICATALAVLMLGCSAVTVLPEVAQSGILASAASEGTTDEGFAWEENIRGGVTITSYTGEGGNVVIPDKIDGKAVTEIGDSAFLSCDILTGITISDNVTNIGSYSFRFCSNLTSVTMGNSVETIGKDAFDNCTELTSIDIPESVIGIGDFAFCACTKLESFNVNSNNKIFSSQDGVLFSKDKTILFYYPAGRSGSYDVPDSVKTIDGYAFFGCIKMTSVTIPDSVKSMGSFAFSGCTGLKSVTIGNGVSEIGWRVFELCLSLTSITMGTGVKTIGELAFGGCTELTSITIGSNVRSIGKSAFANCKKLKSIVIPGSVTYIDPTAFDNCYALRTIYGKVGSYAELYTIGTNITFKYISFVDGDFEFIDNLDGTVIFSKYAGTSSDVIIPLETNSKSVVEIDENAFLGCKKITSITIPGSVEFIDSGAFDYCSGLTSISVDSNNKDYSSESGVLFNKDKNILIRYPVGKKGTYTIPNSVEKISICAFLGCKEMTSVTVPDSVSFINPRAFANCSELTYINADENNENYSSENGILFNKDKSVLECYPAGRNGEYTIPDSVESIYEYAFSGCTGLTSVDIPDSVTTIREYAFYGCTGLTGVTIPDSVTTIDWGSFYRCTGLTSVTIPDSVTFIASGAFSGCTGLTNVSIPDSVTWIDVDAFKGCTGLTSIDVSSKNENYSSDNGVLLNKDQKKLVLCPEGFKGFYTIPTTVTSIGYDAFRGCTGLTSVSIPDSVTSIEYSAFRGCTGLTSASIPDSVTSIGSGVFYGCTGLKSVSIPDSVESIGDSAFFGCIGLTRIEVSSNNKKYSSDDGVLLNKTQTNLICCPSGLIGSYTIPITVISINYGAFYGCTGLTSVTIPDSVILIGSYAFYGCTGLTSVTIPDSVISIGSYAFYDCTELTSMTIPKSVEVISCDDVFYGCDNLVIYGYKNSYAISYAMENGIPFVVLGKELKDFKTNVTIIGDIGKNIKFEVSELKPGNVQISGKKACAYYDISLTENGVKVQPNGNVVVKIPYKDGGENIEVYRINDDGTTEKMQSSYDGEYVTFITDHFSKYAIVTDGGIEGDTNNDGEVNIADALMISRYDAGMAELDGGQLAVSDVNGDGEVNIADALMISRFDAGMIDKL